MKASEWTNIKVAITNLQNLITKNDPDDFEYFEEMLELQQKRFERAEKPGYREENKRKIANGCRSLLEELGLRPMPASKQAQVRLANQIQFHGCPTNECDTMSPHCGKCGLHGHRSGDGKHECKPKFGNA